MRRLKIAGLAVFLGIAACQTVAVAAESAEVEIPHSPAALRRGAAVITGVCMSCHSLKYVKYGDLAQLGFNAKELDALRSGKKLKEPMVTDMSPDMLRESFGTLPPDLSLMANAREGGAAYIYSLLTGFYHRPDGSVDNHAFPGVKMPDVLSFSDAADAAQRAPLEEQAKDAAAFLDWAADPHAGERRHLGYYVLAYLLVLTVLLYLSKRRVWARLAKLS